MRIPYNETPSFTTAANVHIPGVLAAIAKLGLPHRLIEPGTPEDRELTEWTLRMFPWGVAQIDWTQVPGHKCVNYIELDDLVVAFGPFLESRDPQTPVVVMWGNALCPSLEMQLSDVLKIARAIFEEHETSRDVLVFSGAGGWLIEMHHEGTLCMGPAGTAIH